MENPLETSRLLFVLDVLAWLSFFAASGRYIKYASALTDFIDTRCPDLWQRLAYRRRSSPFNYWRSARRLDNLIVFNIAGAHRPADPVFRTLLGRARLSAAAALVFFLTALILLAQIEASLRG